MLPYLEVFLWVCIIVFVKGDSTFISQVTQKKQGPWKLENTAALALDPHSTNQTENQMAKKGT